jgi:hypothetical protein
MTKPERRHRCRGDARNRNESNRSAAALPSTADRGGAFEDTIWVRDGGAIDRSEVSTQP